MLAMINHLLTSVKCINTYQYDSASGAMITMIVSADEQHELVIPLYDKILVVFAGALSQSLHLSATQSLDDALVMKT